MVSGFRNFSRAPFVALHADEVRGQGTAKSNFRSFSFVQIVDERQLTGKIYVVFVAACILHEPHSQTHTGRLLSSYVCKTRENNERCLGAYFTAMVRKQHRRNSHVLALSIHTTKCRQVCSPSNPNTFLSGKLPVVSFPYLLTILFQLVCLTRDPMWCHTDSLLLKAISTSRSHLSSSAHPMMLAMLR